MYSRHRISSLLLIAAFLTAPVLAQDTDTAEPLADTGPTPTLFDNPDVVERYSRTITAEDLSSHLYFFASDFFEGRETTTRGQKLAAHYLAAQYSKMGVAPKGTAQVDNPDDPAAYFQPVPLYGQRTSATELTVTSGGDQIIGSRLDASGADGHSYLLFGNAPETTGGVVFGGYGIADDDLGYNDFAAIDAAGIDFADDWLMILADEPMSDAETSLLTEDGSLSEWTTGRFNKLRYLLSMEPRPKGLLIVSDASPGSEGSVARQAENRAASIGGVGSLALEPPQEGQDGGRGGMLPVFAVSTEFADALLAPVGQSISDLKATIADTRHPMVLEAENVEVTGRVEREVYETSSENVAGFIEGSDPALKNEVVVLSSHYDHIGIESGEGDVINNGADDDGSGTVTILEIAEAFAAAKRDGYGPRRSILFLNVTGEEKGLLGSAYYSDHEPILPLENTVTNLNIDMIGRIDPTHPGETSDYVYIIGSKLISQELHDINVRVNEVIGTNLDLNERFNSKDDPNRFYARSDHWNFGKHGIPFIFFFTGTHEDYHGVGDHPDKIEYERMERIAHVIFGTAWQVANQDAPPAVSGEGFN